MPRPLLSAVRSLYPPCALPKSGGAIRGMGKKFAAYPVTGRGSTRVPIAASPRRCGLGSQLSSSHDSSTVNAPFVAADHAAFARWRGSPNENREKPPCLIPKRINPSGSEKTKRCSKWSEGNEPSQVLLMSLPESAISGVGKKFAALTIAGLGLLAQNLGTPLNFSLTWVVLSLGAARIYQTSCSQS